LLTHAFEKVPYYRGLSRKQGVAAHQVDLKNLAVRMPVLPKQKLRRDSQEFVSEAPLSHPVTIHTSGTSGSPLSVRTSREAVQSNYAFFARYLGWHGVHPRDHGATFAGRLIVPQRQKRPPFWRHNRAMDTLLLSSYHLAKQWLPAYVEALGQFQPHFIDAYPSAIATVAAFMNAGLGAVPNHITPRVIITSSETLQATQRDEIETAFGCKVRDHYGCAEMAALITECEHGSYNVNPEFGIVEILREDGSPCAPGEPGELCCTGFLNHRMPLIRYLIGDRATLSPRDCACGRAFPVIEQLLGRSDDIIVAPDGRQVGRLDPAFKGSDAIVEAQIIQHALDEVEVLVVAGAAFDDTASRRLRADLQHRLSSLMKIRIRTVDAIPRERNGKFRAVVSRISRPN